jgi:hypothetical protein
MTQRTWVGFVKESIWRKKGKCQKAVNQDSWAWFSNGDLQTLAKSRYDIKSALLKNPNLLFETVEQDVLFVDLVIKEKSLREADLVSVGKHVKLDWGKIANKLRISNDLLEKHKNQIDWTNISTNEIYVKDVDFIERFADKLVWTDSLQVKLESNDLDRLLLSSSNSISISNAISCCPFILIQWLVADPKNRLSLLSEEDWKMLISKDDHIIAADRAITDHEGIIEKNLEKMPEVFMDACLRNRYLPKHGNILSMCKMIEGKGFFEICKPDETYLLEHKIISESTPDTLWKEIIDSGVVLSKETIVKYAEIIDWDALTTREENPIDLNAPDEQQLVKYIPDSVVLSRSKGLPAKYIDKNAYRVNWTEVCEHQVLPEWLMRKHVDKLDWEKVKAFQTLSHDFIKDVGYKMDKST